MRIQLLFILFALSVTTSNALAQTAEVLFKEAGRAFARHDYDRAISLCTDALRAKPKYAALIYLNRGAAHKKKGDLDKAFADCNEALRLNPKLAGAYVNRGLVYQKRDDSRKLLPISIELSTSIQRTQSHTTIAVTSNDEKREER